VAAVSKAQSHFRHLLEHSGARKVGGNLPLFKPTASGFVLMKQGTFLMSQCVDEDIDIFASCDLC
jgi:hypothetical protein